MISVIFPSISKKIKNEITKIPLTLTFVQSHRPSLFTQRNKLMGCKGMEHSQEIFHPASIWGVKLEMVIFTPI